MMFRVRASGQGSLLDTDKVAFNAHQECVGRVRLLLLYVALLLGLTVPDVHCPAALLQEALEHGVAAAGRQAAAQLTVLLLLL